MKLFTQLHLVPRSRMSGSVSPVLICLPMVHGENFTDAVSVACSLSQTACSSHGPMWISGLCCHCSGGWLSYGRYLTAQFAGPRSLCAVDILSS